VRSELLKLQRRLFRQKFAALPVFLVTGFRRSPLNESNVAASFVRIKIVDSFFQKYGLFLACLLIFFLLLIATYLAIELTYGFEAFEQIVMNFIKFWLSRFLAFF